jgi:acylphosphatase
MSDDDPVAAHVFYAGHVQGVGFRATAARLAGSHPVNGWVRNLPDGRVELWATGPRPVVEAFLAAVRTTFSRHLSSEAATWHSPPDDEAGFSIR